MINNITFYNIPVNNKLYSENKIAKKQSVNNNSIKYHGYYYPFIAFCGKEEHRNYNNVKVDIPNFHSVNGKGLRGESLSIKRNSKFLPLLHDLGIKHIIDLKTSDFSKNFQANVEKNSMTYSHFPIDSEKTSDREIINNLPELFEIINNGDFYIACAQGLHRTDIALAINYIFNKDAIENPPILYGHLEKSSVRVSDIFRRTNSIFKSLTGEDRKKLGLENFDENKYKAKKKELMEFNNHFISSSVN